MPNLTELLLLAGLGALLFGNRLPKVGKSLGRGIRGFKAGIESLNVTGSNDAAKKADVGQGARLQGHYAPTPQERPRVQFESAPASIPGQVALSSHAPEQQKVRAAVVDADLDARPDNEAR